MSVCIICVRSLASDICKILKAVGVLKECSPDVSLLVRCTPCMCSREGIEDILLLTGERIFGMSVHFSSASY